MHIITYSLDMMVMKFTVQCNVRLRHFRVPQFRLRKKKLAEAKERLEERNAGIKRWDEVSLDYKNIDLWLLSH